jgi:ParB-like chromosome segregation protein Spo0J
MPNQQPLAKDRKTDYWWVDSRRLVFEEGYNERENFGDIQGLARSIKSGGIKNPLRCFKQGETYVVKRGHRRTMALRILEKEGKVIMVPTLLVPKGYNPEEAILDLIVENDTLPFTPWEQAKVVRRLRNLGWDEDRMVEESGKTLVYIRRLLSLADAPQKLINLIREGRIKGTFAMDMIAEGRVDELIEKAETTKGPAVKEEPELFPAEIEAPRKPDKITKSDLKPNSWKTFRKWSKTVDEKELPAAKAKIFKFLKQMEEGELTEENFIEFFT